MIYDELYELSWMVKIGYFVILLWFMKICVNWVELLIIFVIVYIVLWVDFFLGDKLCELSWIFNNLLF